MVRARYANLVIVSLALAACRGRDSARQSSAGESAAAGASTGTTIAGKVVAKSACAADNGGLTLPEGFCATIFADSIGHARHLVVAPNGVVYVNTWSGTYYGGDKGPGGGYIVALRDTTGDGRADVVRRFGPDNAHGGHGGTGIALHDGALYVEESDRIDRYALPSNDIAPSTRAEVVVSGMPLGGDHPMHPFAIDSGGAMYVDMGSATNACQVKNRTLRSPGHRPCTELETRGGIWRFDAGRTGQKFSPAQRFATGIRNADGITIAPRGAVYATQHGRDQLAENWPKRFTPEQGQNLPAEEVLLVHQGAEYGWPYCYYDPDQKKLVLAPEYGGDGKQASECASKRGPVAAFPAHWAPLDLHFYAGSQFPERYRGGLFVVFHGSWNRAPGPQGGYNVVFQPFADTLSNGAYEVFADGFAGAQKQPGLAAHRPAGIAEGPDGALYITDDQHGRVWRVTHRGSGS